MRAQGWGPAEGRRLFRFVLAATAAAWLAGLAAFVGLLAWSGADGTEWRSVGPFAALASSLLWVWPVVYYPWEFAGRGRLPDAEPGAAADTAAR